MRIEIHHHHHHDPAIEQRLGQIQLSLRNLGEIIMSAISDFAVKQNAHNAKVSSDLDAINTGISNLNALIATLQNSAGTVTPEDQATLDQIEAAGAALETKADALANVQPPAVPTP
jgi:hypothetical protein